MRERATDGYAERAEEPPEEREAARVVYTLPPIALAEVVEAKEGGRFTLRIGARVFEAGLDERVDPELVRAAIERGERVVFEPGEGVICGALLTARPLVIDRAGDVVAEVRRLRIDARSEALIRTASSFLHLELDRAELFASETLVRARGAFRALATVIKLN